MKLSPKGRFRIKQNITFKLRGKDGEVKSIFAPNKLFSKLIESGILSPKAWKVPVIFGSWKDSLTVSNLVVDAGKAGVASRLNGAGAEAVFTWIALGTGVVAANAADTTLGTEIVASGGERASASASRVTTDVTDDTARLVNTFNFTASFAVTESGVLNAGAAGTLLSRQVFAAINVNNGDSLQVTWDHDID